MYFSEWISNKLKPMALKVLILIMLDVLLGADKEGTIDKTFKVLILIMLDVLLGVYKKGEGMKNTRLNPYYVGCTSRRRYR